MVLVSLAEMPDDTTLALADATDVPAITAVRNAAAERLTSDFGAGHWSSLAREASVRRHIVESRVLVVRTAQGVAGTLRLATKKPWAINPALFTRVRKAIYLLDMAVHPDWQRRGIGRRLMTGAANFSRAAGFEAIRLDAYDSPAGAGAFYEKCGYAEVGRVEFRGTPLIYYETLLGRG
jgi:ribosomal protein S18 acetylase RimI-like enzyme